MRLHALTLLLVPAAWIGLAFPSHALKAQKDEEASLKACEKSVCEIILSRNAKGRNPDCNITKTWSKETIKEGESSAVTWAFGDTRCKADLKVSRAEIVLALTKPKYVLQAAPQTVRCVVESDGKPHDLIATAAPKLKFKGGRADKIWINLQSIEGPDNIKGTISTIAAMEDKLGIFHRPLIKSVNKFIHKRCAKKYGPDAVAEADDDADAPKKKPAKAKKSDAAKSEAAKAGAAP